MLVTVKEYAKINNMSYSTVRSAIHRGKLKPIKKEGEKHYKLEHTDDWASVKSHRMYEKKNEWPYRKRIRRLFSVMKQRCYNPKATRYEYYGGKGITICDEWLKSPDAFYIWSITHGYEEGLTIDRIDPDKNYEPNNCRWITREENSRRAALAQRGRRYF